MCCYVRIDGVSIVFAAGDDVKEKRVVFFPQAVDRFAFHAPLFRHADFGPVVLFVADKTFLSEGWALLHLVFSSTVPAVCDHAGFGACAVLPVIGGFSCAASDRVDVLGGLPCCSHRSQVPSGCPVGDGDLDGFLHVNIVPFVWELLADGLGCYPAHSLVSCHLVWLLIATVFDHVS